MKNFVILLIAILILMNCSGPSQKEGGYNWKHFSNKNGDFYPPNAGNQQTASLVLDIDKDGVNDFVITERTQSPAVVWYRYVDGNWERYVVDHDALHIEAGSAFYDIDGDGDLDIAFAGDSRSNQVWWWENPYPDFNPEAAWERHLIKNDGANKHHDMIFGDFDGDEKTELVFWNQSARSLFLAEIPENPWEAESWNYTAIYEYLAEETVPQIGTYPNWKGTNEHEGLAKADIDGDGVEDIIGGGYWFKYEGEAKFTPHAIDESYHFTRSAAGQLIKDGRPEVVLVVGDGTAPLNMYEWKEDEWVVHTLIDTVIDGHSLDIIDFNGDGNLDIYNAEMRLSNENPVTRILLGDGEGNFETLILFEGIGQHESRIADLDGDGDYDILGKPYTWMAPRVDIWLNEGK